MIWKRVCYVPVAQSKKTKWLISPLTHELLPKDPAYFDRASINAFTLCGLAGASLPVGAFTAQTDFIWHLLRLPFSAYLLLLCA
jgi:hypothetical protein